MGKNVQGGGNSTDDGPEAGAQREGRAYDLVGRGHGRAGVSLCLAFSPAAASTPLCQPQTPCPQTDFPVSSDWALHCSKPVGVVPTFHEVLTAQPDPREGS